MTLVIGDWSSPEVASFENGYAGDSRWFYITYLRGGTALEFSTEKAFGKGTLHNEDTDRLYCC